MKKWLRKSLVLLFSIMTLGLVSPPQVLLADENSTSQNETLQKISNIPLSKPTEEKNINSERSNEYHDHPPLSLIEDIIYKAEQQSLEKFGGRIGPIIEEEFKMYIFPKMEEVLTSFLESESESFEKIVISTKPTGGKSEKIFHIYDEVTGKDLIRFHVRVDHPPQEGYWFNFHYHTYHDQYQTHYELGKIYWDQNTPPNWLTH